MKANDTPPLRDVVLLGGGHANVQVLKRFGMRPEPGLRLTIVAREPHSPYTGMLPGHVAGAYTWDDIHVDLARLAAFAKARCVAAEATAGENETIDPVAGHIADALNAPFQGNLGDDGRFLEPAALQHRFNALLAATKAANR